MALSDVQDPIADFSATLSDLSAGGVFCMQLRFLPGQTVVVVAEVTVVAVEEEVAVGVGVDASAIRMASLPRTPPRRAVARVAVAVAPGQIADAVAVEAMATLGAQGASMSAAMALAEGG